MTETSTIAAGIDVAKAKLDIAVDGCSERWQVANTPHGFRDLVRLMRRRKVTRIGLEASGGYERDVVEHLRKAGFTVVVLQPIQVRAFATFMLCRAKSDKIDAGLIAACVAYRASTREAPDPRLAPLADLLTFIEQIEEDIACNKVRLEHARNPDQRRFLIAEVKRLKTWRGKMLAKLAAAFARMTISPAASTSSSASTASASAPAWRSSSACPSSAASSREEAGCLAGLAPFVHESGERKDERPHRRRTRAPAQKPLFRCPAGRLLPQRPAHRPLSTPDQRRKAS